jgi:hypothetical protein
MERTESKGSPRPTKCGVNEREASERGEPRAERSSSRKRERALGLFRSSAPNAPKIPHTVLHFSFLLRRTYVYVLVGRRRAPCLGNFWRVWSLRKLERNAKSRFDENSMRLFSDSSFKREAPEHLAEGEGQEPRTIWSSAPKIPKLSPASLLSLSTPAAYFFVRIGRLSSRRLAGDQFGDFWYCRG